MIKKLWCLVVFLLVTPAEATFLDLPDDMRYNEIVSHLDNLKDLSYYTSTHKEVYAKSEYKIWKIKMEEKFFIYPDIYEKKENFFPYRPSCSWRHISVIGSFIEQIKTEAHENIFLWITYSDDPGLEINIRKKIERRNILGLQLEGGTSYENVKSCILDMNTHIQEEDIDSCLTSLAEKSYITGLNFSGWFLTGRIQNFCVTLLANHKIPSLKVLNLGFNSLNNEDALHLACYLPAHIKLQSLCLANNAITCIGGGAIATMVGLNRSLKDLDLRGNWIGRKEVKRIKKIWTKKKRDKSTLKLQHNKSLKDLTLHYKDILF